MKPFKYVVISPVKDEEKYIAQTMESVISQTVQPSEWLIVDDGSTDDTVKIIRRYAQGKDWIKVILNRRDPARNTGVAEMLAFKLGLQHITLEDYDFIVKLDGDLRFERDYFEKILDRLNTDACLGIASGVYLEKKKGQWKVIEMPGYHAAGASKILRKPCFEQIGGFITEAGWDTVDEIRAQYLGWGTTHFKDVLFYHLKNEGSGMGYKKTNLMHGEIYYRVGGSKLFLAFKLLDRIFFSTPFLLAGFYLLVGYLRPMVERKPLLVDVDEARFYRAILIGRLKEKINWRIFHKGRSY
jgi:glycosyltransferase involved in cell wall biosynthesis